MRKSAGAATEIAAAIVETVGSPLPGFGHGFLGNVAALLTYIGTSI